MHRIHLWIKIEDFSSKSSDANRQNNRNSVEVIFKRNNIAKIKLRRAQNFKTLLLIRKIWIKFSYESLGNVYETCLWKWKISENAEWRMWRQLDKHRWDAEKRKTKRRSENRVFVSQNFTYELKLSGSCFDVPRNEKIVFSDEKLIVVSLKFVGLFDEAEKMQSI